MLPDWPGASTCYSRAYRLLEIMAQNATEKSGVPMPLSRPHNLWERKSRIVVTEEMQELIDALNRGDEETIKGLLLQHRAAQRVG